MILEMWTELRRPIPFQSSKQTYLFTPKKPLLPTISTITSEKPEKSRKNIKNVEIKKNDEKNNEKNLYLPPFKRNLSSPRLSSLSCQGIQLQRLPGKKLDEEEKLNEEKKSKR